MMRKKILYSIFLVCLSSFLLVACKKESYIVKEKSLCIQNNKKPVLNTNNIQNLPEIAYDTNVCGLFPIGKNYQWIYRDSFFDQTGNFIEVKMDTVTVEKTVLSLADNSVFWKIKSTKPKGLLNYIYSTDSVLYVIDKLYSYNNTTPLLATEWLKAYPVDSINKFSFISDIGYRESIVKLQNKITVPAGTFTNCIKNTKSTNGAEEIIFKPELGVVRYTKYSPYGNPFNPAFTDRRQVSELVKYHLQ